MKDGLLYDRIMNVTLPRSDRTRKRFEFCVFVVDLHLSDDDYLTTIQDQVLEYLRIV